MSRAGETRQVDCDRTGRSNSSTSLGQIAISAPGELQRP